MGYYSRSGFKQVYSRSIFSGEPLHELLLTRYVQFGGIVPSLMNGTIKIIIKKLHEIEVIHDQFLGLEPELPNLHEMTSDQYISLHVNGFTTWIVQICCLAIFHPRNKLGRPMCGNF